jgi:hypothetical protein
MADQAAIAQMLGSKMVRGNPIAVTRVEPDVEANVVAVQPRKLNTREVPSAGDQRATTVWFQDDIPTPVNQKTLYIPPPHLRDQGAPLVEIEPESILTEKDSPPGAKIALSHSGGRDRGRSLERVASAALSIGPSTRSKSRPGTLRESTKPQGLPSLSKEVTVGRNSHFQNLSAEDRDILGGVEYVALKLLLKIIVGQ